MSKVKDIVNLVKPKSIILGDDMDFDSRFTKRIMDVRSAAFYAFGESKITNENVLLVIDGDYLPSVYTVLTEAWFQKTNLIVLALYDSIYDIETNYLNRCTVANIKFIDKDLNKFEDKINKALGFIGPKVINVVTKKRTNEYDYSKILKALEKVLDKDDTVFTFSGTEYKSKYELVNIPKKYKYGVISKYLARLEGKKNNNILLCTKDCIEIDSNIFNNREMNAKFKMIVVGDILKSKNWIINNGIAYVEANNLKKDLEDLVVANVATVLIVKEDL